MRPCGQCHVPVGQNCWKHKLALVIGSYIVKIMVFFFLPYTGTWKQQISAESFIPTQPYQDMRLAKKEEKFLSAQLLIIELKNTAGMVKQPRALQTLPFWLGHFVLYPVSPSSTYWGILQCVLWSTEWSWGRGKKIPLTVKLPRKVMRGILQVIYCCNNKLVIAIIFGGNSWRESKLWTAL